MMGTSLGVAVQPGARYRLPGRGAWVASTMMSGIGTPYSSTRRFSVIPVVAGSSTPSAVSSDAAQHRGQLTDLAKVALRELDQLRVLVAAGEDDDHAVDLRRLPARRPMRWRWASRSRASSRRVWLTYRTRRSWMIVLTVRTLLSPVTAS